MKSGDRVAIRNIFGESGEKGTVIKREGHYVVVKLDTGDIQLHKRGDLRKGRKRLAMTS